MKKGVFLSLVFLLMLSVALAGCGGSTESSGESGQNGESAGNSEGGEGETTQDTLIFGRGADSASLDPSRVTDGESFYPAQNIYDTLLKYGKEDTTLEPRLATEWKTSEDGLTYTLTLREGVKFHDGTDFNAEAVVYNFNRWLDGDRETFPYFVDMFGGFRGDEGAVIKEVKAVDEFTVEFTLNRPMAPFLKNLAMTPFSIASPTALEEQGAEAFAKNPVGTGPFKFKEWKPNDTITLVKNEDYWEEGKPKINTLIFQVIPENSARLTALKTGEIDLMNGVNPSDVKELEQSSELQLFLRPPMNVAYMGFNTRVEPFGDPKVRRALNHAVNKEAIIDAFYAGNADPAKNPMPPVIEGFNDEIEPYEFDLDKAKELLAEAGYPDGFEMDLWVMPNPRDYIPEPQKVAEAIQADFEKIGVKVNLVTYEWATYTEKIREGESTAYFLGWIGDNGDADNFLYTLLDPTNNEVSTGYENDELHETLVAAQTEVDEEKRAELYKKAQELIHEDAPWIPLVYAKPALAGKANLKGYVPHPTGTETFTEVYFE